MTVYLTGGGYGFVGNSGKHPKLIVPVCFYYCLLCSSGEAAKFSSVSALGVSSLFDGLWGEEMECVRPSYVTYSSR